MTEYKRDYPRRGQKVVKGFFFEAGALNLSLEATGLAAHIYSFDDDCVDEEFLRRMFPDRDLSGPLRELASIGLIELVDYIPSKKQEDKPEPAAAARAGSIYLIEGGGRFKIGITKSTSAKSRLTSLQTGSPVQLRIVYTAFVTDSASAEGLAHGLLARFRLHGEWFECTEERAISILNMVVDAVGPATK